MKDPILGLRALIEFKAQLADEVSGEESVDLEFQRRLGILQAMVDSGDWVADENSNVMPAHMSDADRQIVREHCRYTLIDAVPTVRGNGASLLSWKAAGSIITGTVVIDTKSTAPVNLHLNNSVIDNSRINIK